jgi:hypothetical protein
MKMKLHSSAIVLALFLNYSSEVEAMIIDKNEHKDI